jgi:hypothetical protein|tara:strand:+ start:295 stop:612 length:318 start_codon:yes stop_codon:yes gene_type:complete
MKEVVQLSELITDMLNDREETHGKAEDTFFVGARFVSVMSNQISLQERRAWQSHEYAVLNILLKLSRIICGRYSADHWDDIIGYAKLGKDLHRGDDGSDGENNNN